MTQNAHTRAAFYRSVRARSQTYCLSKTVVLLVGWPCALVPFEVRVVTFPSRETTAVVVWTTLPFSIDFAVVVFAPRG
jgi:hypothetical protein